MGVDAFDPVAPASPLANVGPYLVTATGSTTARTLAARAADVVNVKDFGAKGNGTDDTAAIQTAIDSLIGKGGQVLFPTAPNYYVASPLVLDTRHESISIVGMGWGRGSSVPAPVRITGASTCIKTATTGSYQPGAGNFLNGIEISNILFVGAGGHDHLVSLNGIQVCKVINVHTSGATVGKDNFQLSNVIDATFLGFNAAGAGRYGLNLGTGVGSNSSTGIKILGGYVKNCRDAGVWAAGANQLSHFVLIGTELEQNGRAGDGTPNGGLGYGLVLDNADNAHINPYCEANTTGDVIIGGIPTNTSGAFTVGSGCRAVDVWGYYQGQPYAGTQTREGLKVVKVEGLTVNGIFDDYSYSHIAIDDANTGAVKGVRFGALTFLRLGSAFIRDAGGRLALGAAPSQWDLPETAYYSVTPATLSAGMDLQVLTAAGADSAALPAGTRTGQIITIANQGAGTKTITGAAAGSVTIAQGIVKRFEYDVAWGLWSSVQ